MDIVRAGLRSTRCQRRIRFESAADSIIAKRINESDALKLTTVLKILADNHGNAGFASSGPDESVPERQAVSRNSAESRGRRRSFDSNTSPRSRQRETAVSTSGTATPRRSDAALNSLRHCALSTSSPRAPRFTQCSTRSYRDHKTGSRNATGSLVV